MPTLPADMAGLSGSELHCRILEIDSISATWQCEQYRKLLEQSGGDAGHLVLQRPQSESELPITGSGSSQPPTPSGLTPQWQQVLPSAWQDNSDHGGHRGSVFTAVCIWIASSRRSYLPSRTPAPSELVPPVIVHCNSPRLENRELFVPGTIATLCTDNSPHNRSTIFGAAGLFDHQLTPLEATWARKTPKMPWKTFTWVFGGIEYCERPLARKVSAYEESFICTVNVTQPFAPTRVGEPGVILLRPDAVLLEDTKDTFHVFVDPSAGNRTKLQYCGIYTKVQTPYIMEVQPDEWHALPRRVSNFPRHCRGL